MSATNRPGFHVLATLFAAAIATLAHAVDSIVLKSVVRMPAEATVVRLGDIAYLEGEEALRLAGTEIAPIGDEATFEIPLEAIRSKLTTAGARWASIDFSGRSVRIRWASGDRPLAMRGMAVDEDSLAIASSSARQSATQRDEFLADEAVGAPTARGLIAELIRNVHASKGVQVRLVIEGAKPGLLDDRDPRRRYEVVPLSSLSTDRVVVRVITRDGDRVVARDDVSVTPSLEAQVALATRSIRRSSRLDIDAYSVATRFVSPSEFAAIAAPDTLAGATVVDSLGEGDMIVHTKVRRAIEIRKNDRVTVRRELGMVAIELAAVALEDGAVGEPIQLQVVDRKNRRDRRTFTAVVTGPGHAVLRQDA